MNWYSYDPEYSQAEYGVSESPDRAEMVAWLRHLADHIEREAPMVEPPPPARLLEVTIGYAPTSAVTNTLGPVPVVALWHGRIPVDGPRVEIDLRGVGLPPDIAIGKINLEAKS